VPVTITRQFVVIFKFDIVIKIPISFHMNASSQPMRKVLMYIALAFILTAALLYVPRAASGSDLIKYSLCDIQVLYIFDEEQAIDWPTLYYLNDMYGCRIDLLAVRSASSFRHTIREVPDEEIYLHEYDLPENQLFWIDSLFADLFKKRRPDIVLLDESPSNRLCKALSEQIVNLPAFPSRLFNILKIYRRVSSGEDTTGELSQVVLNSNELLTRYRQRMKDEIPYLFADYEPQAVSAARLTRYELVSDHTSKGTPEVDFISGIDHIRLTEVLEKRLPDGPKKQTLLKQANGFIADLTASQQAAGKARADLVIDGYKKLLDLASHKAFDDVLDSLPDFRPYLGDLLAKTEKAALGAVGLLWEGKIIVRDSSHGPKVKFRLSLSSNGPKEIELATVCFHPYWDTSAVTLDSFPTTILPHQSLVREYVVDMDASRLETDKPESLLFTTEISYGKLPLVLSRSLPLREAEDLRLVFAPDFYFVKPLPDLEVDRVVSSMDLKVVISKPRNYAKTVHLNLEPPRGLFAGAYRQEIELTSGSTVETVRIPFSISNLFELGIHPVIATLSVDNRVVAADSARVRIASCEIPEEVKIGFLPDSTGLLEDILHMTDAAIQPLTDRSLMTADLDAYNVIIIGSGSFRRYPSLPKIKRKFEDYVRFGGSIIVMGQTDDWPEGVLPIALAPMAESVDKSQISSAATEAGLLVQPYEISNSNLLASFDKRRQVNSAVVSPAGRVYQTDSGAALLSVSHLGEGQIIYCGFPLLEMISRLEIDAIHLFANILNY
jgi:hypothetical protein